MATTFCEGTRSVTVLIDSLICVSADSANAFGAAPGEACRMVFASAFSRAKIAWASRRFAYTTGSDGAGRASFSGDREPPSTRFRKASRASGFACWSSGVRSMTATAPFFCA